MIIIITPYHTVIMRLSGGSLPQSWATATEKVPSSQRLYLDLGTSNKSGLDDLKALLCLRKFKFEDQYGEVRPF